MRRNRSVGPGSVVLASVALLIAMVGVVGPRTPAVAQSDGGISGRVTTGVGDTPVPSMAVGAQPVGATTWVVATVSDADGRYRLGGLATGDYLVQFYPRGGGYVGEWWNDRPDAASADVVHVVVGTDTTGIDARMVRLGSISGRVTGPDGAPVPAAGVRAIDTAFREYPGYPAGPFADGTYRIGELPAGAYRILFDTPPYTRQYWNGKITFETADVIILDGNDVTGVDARLTLPGSVAGRVVDADGAAAPDVWVSAFAITNGPTLGSTAWGRSGADGTYSIVDLPAGVYKLRTASVTGAYAPTWFDHRLTWDLADTVSVASGATTADIVVHVERAGVLSGTVRTTAGAPVAGIVVSTQARYEDKDGVGGTVSGADGTFRFVGLNPADVYRVDVHDPSGVYTSTAFDVQVGAGVELVRDVVLTPVGGPSGSISGQISVRGHGPLGTVTVAALLRDGTVVTSVDAAADGRYTLVGLPPGRYVVEAIPSAGSPLAARYFEHATALDEADAVKVVADRTTRHIDIELRRRSADTGSVTGRVTGRHDGPLAGVTVQLLDRRAQVVASTSTDSDGRYVVEGITPGRYVVQFVPATGSRWRAEFYDDAPTWSRADAVTVRAGRTLRGIDAELSGRPAWGHAA